MVEYLTHDPKAKGSKPTTDIRRKKTGKNERNTLA
jgi:hypothetical protein